MVFIETQKKGGKTYHYLTKTVRVNNKFKKNRILLSDIELSGDKLKKLAQEKMVQLEQLLNISFDPKKVVEKYVIWERPCNIALAYMAAKAVVLPQKKNFGYHWGKTYGFYKEGMVKFVWDKKYMTKSGISVVQNMIQKNYFDTKIRQWKKLCQDLEQQYEKCVNLHKLSNRKLIKLFKNFNKIYLEWWGFGQVAELVALGSEYILNDKIKELNILTSPSEKSYSVKEEEEILKIAIQVKNDKRLTKLFQKNTEDIVQVIHLYPKLEEKLNEHVKKYFWIQNNYSAVRYCNINYFIDNVKNALEHNPKRSLIAINDRLNHINKERNKILEKIDPKLKKIAQLIDYFAIFQDNRKAMALKANEYKNNFLKELSKRTGVNLNLLYYSTPYEYDNILMGKFNIGILAKRQKGFVQIITSKKIEISYNYKTIYNRFFRDDEKNITEFEGRRAEGGIVTGPVKIILDPRKSDNFKKGDILVTTMTTPDFIYLMKKASAIITDEGGITCHASIVARELGIPCVIGTKIATNVLNDNYIVEVNANHGIVKIKSHGNA